MKKQYDKVDLFKRNMSTLKETSLDNDNGQEKYMTYSEEVVNFDGVKELYIKKMALSATPCSSDALYIDENEKYTFIEFKNGQMSKQKVYNVYNKIYDSLLIFTDIIEKNISFCRQNVDFVLVYNEVKNMENTQEKMGDSSKVQIAKYFSKKAKKIFVRFDLQKFEKIYFRQVFTYTEREFEEAFLSCSENVLPS